MINESWTVVADSPLSVGRFKSAGEASSQAPAFFDSPCLLLPCPRSWRVNYRSYKKATRYER